jgi:hypothetical protein
MAPADRATLGFDVVHRFFHVTSTINRASIREHGLDWRRMGAARGIAGSDRPENEGVFLCRGVFDADWFVRLNNTGGPVDVWAVSEIEPHRLLDNGRGYFYYPMAIPPEDCALVSGDIAPLPTEASSIGAAGLPPD